ncbi:MAG: type III PLP-dependent enzyme [Candidatus Magnetobacterium sp. LHC-1]|uniref:type III PLP-dependent enzyme n=1 Tax=Candidatus Magnetobacterium casense TaxID=1455061 RepID=UPI001C455DC4|nr:type III PLP-dependent enzyme [Candidatus Magnetobacterium casensis]
MVKTFKIEPSVARIVDKSTLLKVFNYIDSGVVKTPCLVVNGERVVRNLGLLGSRVRNSRVFYAVKANPAVEVLRLIDGLGGGFEISSDGELRVLAQLGVSPERIISSNPVKTVAFIQQAADYGIRRYAFDSDTEVDKLARYCGGCSVYVRLSIPNEGSEWPLSKKFGVEINDALRLLLYAKSRGLEPCGITFHVGSQCNNIYNWNIALDKARLLYTQAQEAGISLWLLNIGGGYPVKYTRDALAIDTIERHIDVLIRERFADDVEVFIEPGRVVVGDAGIIVASVTGKADRLDGKWLYIDVGVFNGLMESVGGIRYTYVVETTPDTGTIKDWILAGPSCDSFDVIDRNVSLAEPHVGDLVLILSAGAYTTSYASEFNGCAIPDTVIV